MFFIEFSSRSKKFLKNLDKGVLMRVVNRIENLSREPIPSDSKFIGREKANKIFRYRIGIYRVLYKIKSKEKIILITKIGKRGGVYKR